MNAMAVVGPVLAGAVHMLERPESTAPEDLFLRRRLAPGALVKPRAPRAGWKKQGEGWMLATASMMEIPSRAG